MSSLFVIISVIENINTISFSKDEVELRIKETNETINSIKMNTAKSKILLIEAGRIDHKTNIKTHNVNYYHFVGNDKLIRYAVDSKNKSLGELIILIMNKKIIASKTEKRFYKISGRYLINSFFNEDSFSEGISFKHYEINNSFSTRLYCIDKNSILKWYLGLILALPYVIMNRSLEGVFPKTFRFFKVNKMKEIGLSGYVGKNREFLKE